MGRHLGILADLDRVKNKYRVHTLSNNHCPTKLIVNLSRTTEPGATQTVPY